MYFFFLIKILIITFETLICLSAFKCSFAFTSHLSSACSIINLHRLCNHRFKYLSCSREITFSGYYPIGHPFFLQKKKKLIKNTLLSYLFETVKTIQNVLIFYKIELSTKIIKFKNNFT